MNQQSRGKQKRKQKDEINPRTPVRAEIKQDSAPAYPAEKSKKKSPGRLGRFCPLKKRAVKKSGGKSGNDGGDQAGAKQKASRKILRKTSRPSGQHQHGEMKK